MFEEDQLGQGRENAKTFLSEHSETAEIIEGRIREEAGLSSASATRAAKPEPQAKTEDDASTLNAEAKTKKTKSGGKGDAA